LGADGAMPEDELSCKLENVGKLWVGTWHDCVASWCISICAAVC